MSGTLRHPPPTPRATLRIINGPHAQVHTRIDVQRVTVGLDTANDVVLADAMLAPVHFAIERHGQPHAEMRLHAVGGPLLIGELIVAIGGSVACGPRTAFQAGRTAFELDDPQPAGVRRPDRTLRTGGWAAGSCLAVALVSVPLHSVIDAKAQAASASASSVPRARPRANPPVLATREDLRRRLDEAGLSGITLAALQDASVEARGDIMPSQVPAWREVQRWFDARFGGGAVLVDLVAASAAAPPLAIQAVWSGPDPYIIDGAGQKLFPGALLRTGWTLDRVEPDRVIIRRGSQTLAVRF